MFLFLKKKLIASAIKSFMTKITLIDNLYKRGKLSESEYQLKKQQVVFEYQEYLDSIPYELLPDFARR